MSRSSALSMIKSHRWLVQASHDFTLSTLGSMIPNHRPMLAYPCSAVAMLVASSHKTPQYLTCQRDIDKALNCITFYILVFVVFRKLQTDFALAHAT